MKILLELNLETKLEKLLVVYMGIVVVKKMMFWREKTWDAVKNEWE